MTASNEADIFLAKVLNVDYIWLAANNREDLS
jgi:hypothetical protein